MSEFERGTVLAFDLGLKRTGVASGELGIGVAHPLSVIHAQSTDARLAAIEKTDPGVATGFHPESEVVNGAVCRHHFLMAIVLRDNKSGFSLQGMGHG